MRNYVENAWVMAQIEPYSFESVRDSSQSEEDDVVLYCCIQPQMLIILALGSK